MRGQAWDGTEGDADRLLAEEMGRAGSVADAGRAMDSWVMRMAIAREKQKKGIAMKVTEITVSAGRTFNHPFESFSNLRPNVTIKASLEDGEDTSKAINDLQALAEKSVEDHKQAILHSLEELHFLTEAQRDMTSLAEQITRFQMRLEEIRKAHPQLSFDGMRPDDPDIEFPA